MVLGRDLLCPRVAEAAVVHEGVDGVDGHADGLAAAHGVQLHAVRTDQADHPVDQVVGEVREPETTINN